MKLSICKVRCSSLYLIPIILIGCHQNTTQKKDSTYNSFDPTKPYEVAIEGIKQIPNDEINYDLSCLSSADKVIDVLSTIEENVQETFGPSISLQDEVAFGQEFHEAYCKDHQIIKKGNAVRNLKNILSRLQNAIVDPTGYTYKIHYVESEEINAFTIGAQIYVTSALYDFCKTSDELAAVIAHEIYHNELGHTKEIIQKRLMFPDEFNSLYSALTVSFGQSKELNCDLHGVELMIKANFNGCSASKILNRLVSTENQENTNLFEEFFRSHPHAKDRVKCVKNHITTNYQIACHE
jgi:predicted Zn-dependent protease